MHKSKSELGLWMLLGLRNRTKRQFNLHNCHCNLSVCGLYLTTNWEKYPVLATVNFLCYHSLREYSTHSSENIRLPFDLQCLFSSVMQVSRNRCVLGSWKSVPQSAPKQKTGERESNVPHTAEVRLSACMPSCEAPEKISGLNPRGSRRYQCDWSLQSCSLTAFLSPSPRIFLFLPYIRDHIALTI